MPPAMSRAITGFVYKRLTGFTCGDAFDSCSWDRGGDLRQVVYSQAGATFTGAEIGSQIDLVPVGNASPASALSTISCGAQFDDGSFVPRIPPHTRRRWCVLAGGWLDGAGHSASRLRADPDRAAGDADARLQRPEGRDRL